MSRDTIVGLVHRHVRERALARDVADRPHAVGDRGSGRRPATRARVGSRPRSSSAERRPGRPVGRWRRAARSAATRGAVARACTVAAPSARRLDAGRSTPVRTVDAFGAGARGAATLAASGSSSASSRSARLDDGHLGRRSGRRPARARTPIAPPPSTTSDSGSSSASIGLVVGPVRRAGRARRWAGRAAACRWRPRCPGAPRTRCRRPSTWSGAAERPVPRTKRAALAVEPLDGDVCRPSRRSPRRGSASATGVQSGSTVGACRPCRGRGAPRRAGRRRGSSSCDGTQPQYGHSPPTRPVDAEHVEPGLGEPAGDVLTARAQARPR